MTTYAPHDATLDERTRTAWGAYRDELADLSGKAYDEAENTAWERLQETLRDIEGDRAALHIGGDTEH
ncbi:MAG TPA: hypothetical protein VFG42_03325 [Baekduia sp.]|uniref:hypothetical protein n=1 Tax=Baekduia sp. TaxID=2600305 RepID=UPI002D796F3F|nr:hypothetical protein [Baekduia sp.]HET6505800.1 hypothetical protein [Baekduia sp.]